MSPEIEALSRLLGKMFTELDQEYLERLELLEHLINQHDILLESLLTMLEKSMALTENFKDS